MKHEFAFRAVEGPKKKEPSPYGKKIARVSDILGTFDDDDDERLLDWAASLGDTVGSGWRSTRERLASIGTNTHFTIQKALSEEFFLPPPKPEILPPLDKEQERKAECAYRNFKRFRKRHHIEPLALEETIVHSSLPYGGTCDFKGLLDGVPTLLDWKTSRKINLKFKLQVGAYALLHEDRYGVSFKQFGALRLDREAEEYELALWGNVDEAKYIFTSLLTIYHMTRLRHGRESLKKDRCIHERG